MKYLLDNSNLAESYSGVTTPLTYSFASRMYRGVYRLFCEKMGVRKTIIGQHEEEFSNLLSFVGYRMYYNLRNWYTLISFLPAYKLNKQFFDKMLGVEADDPWEPAPVTDSFRKYALELPRVAVQFIRIGVSFMFMGLLVKRFNREFDSTFARLESTDLSILSPPALARLYFDVSQNLLARWWVPIANDFAVMVSTGIATKLLARWLGQTDVASHLYVEAHGKLVSLDPGQHLAGLVSTIKGDTAMCELFHRPLGPAHLLEVLAVRYPASETYRMVEDYLVHYGARVPNELKLESETLNERPEFLVELLQVLVQADGVEAEGFTRRKALRENQYLRVNLVKRALLNWLLSWVGNSLGRREETRFRRALIFGYARRLFLILGRQFHDSDILCDPRDIFYLTENEVFGLVDGSSDPESGKALVGQRKAEMEEWQRLDLPRRIEADGPFEELLENLKSGPHKNGLPVSASELTGTVAARGDSELVCGTALVLQEFSPGADYNGKVLVTCQTDPGWTIIFPFVKALIVERGGILSHAAIVARELGIPCIVGVEGATRLIPDGATVEMVLETGEIRVRSNDSELGSANPGSEICVS